MWRLEGYLESAIYALLFHVLVVVVYIVAQRAAVPIDFAPQIRAVKASLVQLEQSKPVVKAKKKVQPKAKKKTVVKVPKKQTSVPPVKKTVEKVAEKSTTKNTVVKNKEKVAKLPTPTVDFDQLLAEEDQQLAIAEEQELVDMHINLIVEQIVQQWSRPPSARNNMEVLLNLSIVPSGEVLSVNVEKSSGNVALDNSAVLAVERVEKFENLSQLSADVFEKHFRKLTLRFRPVDLRL